MQLSGNGVQVDRRDGLAWKKSSYSGYNGNCVEVAWRKSSYSAQGNCAEVAQDGGQVHVRDSKDPDGPRLSFSPAAWTAFLGSVRAGRL